MSGRVCGITVRDNAASLGRVLICPESELEPMMWTIWLDWYGFTGVQAEWRRAAQRERLVREALGNPRLYLPGDVQLLVEGVRRLVAWIAALLSPSRPDTGESHSPYQPRKRHV